MSGSSGKPGDTHDVRNGQDEQVGSPSEAEALRQAFDTLKDEPSPGAPADAGQTGKTTEPLWPTESAAAPSPAETSEDHPDEGATPQQQDSRVAAPWLLPSTRTRDAFDPLDATTQPAAEFAPTEKVVAVPTPTEPQQPPIPPNTPASTLADEPTVIVPPPAGAPPQRTTTPPRPSESGQLEYPDLTEPLIALPTPVAPSPTRTPAQPVEPPPYAPPQPTRATRPPLREDERRQAPVIPTRDAAPLAPVVPTRPTTPPAQRQAPSQRRPTAPPEWPAAAPVIPAAQAPAPPRSAPAPTPAPARAPVRQSNFSVGGALIVLIVLAVVGVSGYGVYTTTLSERPFETAQVFCADLRSQSYSSAYTLLSPRFQATISERLFVLAYQLHDQLDGVITLCSVPSPSTVGYTFHPPTSASIATLIERNHTLRGALWLILQGNSWRVDQIATSLDGTEVGPLLTQASFCDAIMAGDYAKAYAQLAPGAQADGSESDFAQTYAHAFSGANGGLKLTQCQPDLTTYKVSSASAQVNVTFVTQNAGQQITFPTVFHFALQNGAWKIVSLATSVTPTA
ncbi:MAG TPA: hypothetical protein VKQ36_15835 [Ktedonobacterales bacterium]|nr:hypothetical protein [Ktedonobacterales bacterium]